MAAGGRALQAKPAGQRQMTHAEGLLSRTSGGELTGPGDGVLQETRRDSYPK